MRPTISSVVLGFLKGKKGFTAGGTIEDFVHNKLPVKASTVSRVLRSMAEVGVLDKTYKENNVRYVLYKIK